LLAVSQEFLAMPSILSQFNLKGLQQQAASDSNPAIAVTAGAGSGKTRTLVGRYLSLLESGCPIRSLIAITFTDKAAREMRTRIRSEIEKWLSHVSLTPALSPRERAGVRVDWQTIFSEIDSARIGTIHSLCAEILRAHPAEAGIDPNFSMLEEGLAAALKVQAVDLALIWAANDPQAAKLFGIFKEGEIRRVLGTLLNHRLDIIPKDEIHTPLEGWSQAIETWFSNRFADPVWKDALEDLTNLQAQNPDDKLELARQEVLATWNEVSEAVNDQNWDTALTKLAQLCKAISTGGQKGNWSSADLDAAREAMRTLRDFYDAELKPLIGDTTPKVSWALDGQAAEALPALYILIQKLFQEYQHLKDDVQALDFDDLEGKAAQLLTENAAVRARWQRGIRVVLVDEFQDTNDRQRQIVYAISGFHPSRLPKSVETSEVSGGSSGLFIVGDAKQSIYKFRGADVTVFRQVQSDIAATDGLPIDLDLTFRTHKPLLTTLNALLAPVLGESDDPTRPYQVPFAPLRAYRQAPKSEAITPPYVEFILGLGEDAAVGRMAAATALADRLHQLNSQEGFEWSDMALLFRASTAFEAYEDALEAAGIPFVTVAGRGFYDRPEIRDLLNALTAIADPSDDLALAGLLRSPAIGLSDSDIYHLRYLSGGDQSSPLWESLQTSDVSKDPGGFKTHALNIITELHALVGRAPSAAVLKRYLDLTGYRTMLGMVPGGSRLQRNVDKLLADAHRSRMVHLDDFLAYLQTLRDVGTREGEAPVEAEGTVQLMTVHKAKGLEFPLVVIADAAYQPPSWGSSVLLDEASNLLLGLRDAGGNRPVAWKLSSLEEAERDDAEDKRLLYVAATRAKEKLLINGHVKRLKAGNLSLGGWLARLGEVIGLDEVKLTSELNAPQILDLDTPSDAGAVACSLHPLTPNTQPPHADRAIDQNETHPETSDGRALPDLAAPLQVPEERLLDEKILAREADPPQRVWRVVQRAQRPSGPAWVVGTLVHEAIRRWRFPDDDFDAFITPFALESGLTDQAEIRATIRAVERLLTRFRAHPLWAEINTAERYHEVPYTLPGDRGIIDLLYRTETEWVIADFKTDELRTESEAESTIQRHGYDQQVQRYANAVAAQLGTRPKLVLVFLQVEHDKISVIEIP
jgi:ATP-dependent helicase/nuclease subunit A